MSENTQKNLVQLVKKQHEKKSSKKTIINKRPKKQESASQNVAALDLRKQKQKMLTKRNIENVGVRVAQEESFMIHLKFLAKRAMRFIIIALYFGVAAIAICKAGIIILTAFQEFLHEIFLVTPTPKN